MFHTCLTDSYTEIYYNRWKLKFATINYKVKLITAIFDYKQLKKFLQIAGKLHVEISKLGGTFLDRYADADNYSEQDESESTPVYMGSPMIIRVSLLL